MNESITSKHPGVAVFDLDGTLTDTSRDIAFAINLLKRAHGERPLTTPEVIAAVGRGAPRLIQRLFDIDEANEAEWRPLLQTFNAAYLQHQGERSALYPGIEAMLETLSNELDLYVLSNKPHAATLKETENHKIAKYFKAVWGAGFFPALKPDPTGVLTALRTSEAPLDRGVVVGDLFVDMATGRNAGVPTVFVTWGFGKLEDTHPTPQVVVHTADALTSTVRQLVGDPS